MHHSLKNTILKGLKKLKDLIDNDQKNSTLKQKEVTFKTELLRVCANMKQLREFIILNLHTIERDHSLGHKKNNIKCYECGQYDHKKDQFKKGKKEQGESSSYYRRGNGQDEVRSSKNKTVNHIVGLEDVVNNNMKRIKSENELSKMLDQFTIGIRIGDYIYEALIDTGAEISILPKQEIKMEKMIPCNKKIKGYGDGEIVSCETCIVKIDFLKNNSEGRPYLTIEYDTQCERRSIYIDEARCIKLKYKEKSKLNTFMLITKKTNLKNLVKRSFPSIISRSKFDLGEVATKGNLESHISTVFDLLKRIQQVIEFAF
uniref:Peptidase A2 domain-containing protein n=1 Tax=Strongyloides venezuelensis TaxID=75913 RepID=A0A0K0FIJ5_STRVS